jgi:uncharacterized RmlC-like cupin family protein
MGAIRVVRSADLPSTSTEVSAQKWVRRIFDLEDRITISEACNEPGAISAWHHHGDSTGYVYVLKGKLRIEWGQDNRDSTELSAGDFYVIAPGAIHREANPGVEDQVLIAFAVGSGPKFFDVDGPVAAAGSTREAPSVRVCRADDMVAGPRSEGMTRTVADIDNSVAVGAARNPPGTKSGWHSHGNRSACTYVVQGQSLIEWGPEGRERTELAAGDFYVIRPNTIHREGNPGSKDQQLIAFYLGEGANIVNLDRPEPG